MGTHRIYQDTALQSGATITLSPGATHYLAQVRRLHADEPLILFNGLGGEYSAQILDISKNKINVKVGSYHDVNVESSCQTILVQGVARGEKMDLIVQKAVELGVTEISPILTERCTVKLDAEKKIKRQKHWQEIIISACEQCGRNIIPKINLPMDFSEWIKNFKGRGILLSPKGKNKMGDLNFTEQETLNIVVGPEGGLSPQEVDICLKRNFFTLNLGPRVLRTETAPLVTLAVLQSHFGDLK